MTKEISIKRWGIVFSILISVVAFAIFMHPHTPELISSISQKDWATVGKLIQDPLEKSAITLLLTAVVSFILGRFEHVVEHISNVEKSLTDRLPEKVANSAASALTSIINQLTELRANLARGMVTNGDFTYRTLRYDERTGILFNNTSKDEEAPRNVLFNNKTMASLLYFTKKRGVRLDDLGFQCGSGFGPFLNAYLQATAKEDLNLQSAIDLWIEYDSNAGFGKFIQTRNEETGEISIRLKNSFLTEIIQFRNPRDGLCDFMTGYINGVLSTLPQTIVDEKGVYFGTIVASHTMESSDCVCITNDQVNGCTWLLQSAKKQL